MSLLDLSWVGFVALIIVLLTSTINKFLGGILADPVGSYPSLFGPGSWIGGKDGVGWMIEWPYALPNLVNAVFLFLSAMSVLLSLEEVSLLSLLSILFLKLTCVRKTHESLRQQPDLGLRIGRRLVCLLCCKNNRHGYVPVIADDVDSLSAVSQDVELPSTPVSPTSAPTFFPTTSIHNTSPTTTRPSTSYPNTYETPSPRSDYPAASNILQTAAPDGLEAQSAPDSSSSTTVDTSPVHFETPKKRERLPVSRIWTRNVISTLIAHALLALHVGTYSSLWFVFMSTPRFDPKHPIPPWLKKQHFPFYFTGGLALPPKQIGAALAVLGTIGISLQLLLYPRLSSRLGIVWSYRYSLLLFPIAYFLVPFLVMIPSTTQPPAAVGGILVWLGIVGILFIQVLARTFALPATAILVNNCCPHPSVLGTIHGIGQSVSSASRTLGPVVGSLVFAHGLNVGVVGLAWWTLMVMAALGAVAGTFVKNGNGHEILLEGEEEEEYEEESRK